MSTNRFRYFFVISIVIGAFLVSLGFAEISGQQHAQNSFSHRLAVATHDIETIKAHETSTRVSNELTLCKAENGTRIYLRAYFNHLLLRSIRDVAKYTPSSSHLHPFNLTNINCTALTAKIVASSK